MKKKIIYLIISTILFCSCGSYDLKDSQKYDYTTSGALTDNCFQVIITVQPDKELKSMADQRENAFIKAKDSIASETEKQMLNYFSINSSTDINSLTPEKLNALKLKFKEYSKHGVIDQEYYLIDNSAVLVYRIFKSGIKNEILNN